MKIFATGTAGFTGFYLAKKLLDLGFKDMDGKSSPFISKISKIILLTRNIQCLTTI